MPNQANASLIELHGLEPANRYARANLYTDEVELEVPRFTPREEEPPTAAVCTRRLSSSIGQPLPGSNIATTSTPAGTVAATGGGGGGGLEGSRGAVMFPASPNMLPNAASSLRSPAPHSLNTLHNYLAQVATNASMVMSVPEVWNVQRPEDTPTYADYNETFRLYFGLNVTIMPYVISLGGYVGSLLCMAPIAVLLQESIASQLRAKVVVLTNIYKDFSKHDQIDTYIHLVDALWSTRRVSIELKEVTRTDGFTELRRQEVVSLEVQSWFPRLVRALILVTQFTGACSFTMLMSENLTPLTGLSLWPCLAVSCAILTVLSTLYTTDTCRYFAYVSNTALISSVILFLVGLGLAEKDEGPRWTTPRTAKDVFMLLPFLTGALSASLFAIDIEGSVSNRVIARTQQREADEESHRAAVAMAAAAAASVSSAPHHLPSPPPPVPLPPPPRVPSCGPALPYAHALPDTHLPTLGRTIFLLNRFERLSFVALGIALMIHIGFGEAAFAHFGQSTNPALALTLPPSTLRTVLLVVLTIGSGCGAAYSISAIGTVLDELRILQRLCGLTSSPGHATTDSQSCCTIPSCVRKAESFALRTILFCAVFSVLIVVPFFDVLTSLSGSLGFTNISLLVPAIMDLQAARRKIQAEEEEDRMLLETERDGTAPTGQPQPSRNAPLSSRVGGDANSAEDEMGASRSGLRPLVLGQSVATTTTSSGSATAIGATAAATDERGGTDSGSNEMIPVTTTAGCGVGLATTMAASSHTITGGTGFKKTDGLLRSSSYDEEVSWWRAFLSVRFRVKCAVVSMAVCGSFMSISGTVVAVMEAVNRQK